MSLNGLIQSGQNFGDAISGWGDGCNDRLAHPDEVGLHWSVGSAERQQKNQRYPGNVGHGGLHGVKQFHLCM